MITLPSFESAIEERRYEIGEARMFCLRDGRLDIAQRRQCTSLETLDAVPSIEAIDPDEPIR